ncbi:hypothetical protein SAMN02745174_01583 [Cetobacterium ceti]|uniref:Uncharacterized protein n=1 Tax=Cetobacterium ceti TaxID=180163 RepID=A0A1T4NM10_9FUSO|nr:hypothetical protein [Cetobacterium ceti]SJZ80244.1 hypothetical protein SAMN02745174_01583 [Cetobacterium ceti]
MDKGITILNTNYSINISRDYLNDNKINSYIPAHKNIEILNKILKNFENKKNGAFLISGAYGTGKSFFISVLLNLISKKDYKSINILLEKFERKLSINKTLSKIQKEDYLLVFADDSFKSFSQSILAGINKAITRENLDIYLNTEYKSILNKINNWMKNFPQIYNSLEKEINKREMSIETLLKKLDHNDPQSLNIFKEIYPIIFAGENYISLDTSNGLMDIIENLEKEVKSKYNYKGVIYIFDEFGRYLESNITSIDVKEVQDIAEYSNGLDNDTYFLLITHKDIFQYTNKLSKKENISEWEKVSGRFQKEHLAFEKNTTLDILGETLFKNSTYDIFKRNETNKFNLYIKNLENSKLLTENLENTMDKFYPLNYLSAYLLPDLSQKVAQNERTLFAFLASNENLALQNIINDNFLINLNHLYDYFEDNFKFLPSDSLEYKTYLNSKILLEKTNNPLEINFIKTLSLIYIYNKFKEIEPKEEILQLALNISKDKFENLLENLIGKNFIRYQRHSKHYKLVEETDLNIEEDIRNYIDTNLKIDSYSEILNEYLPLNIYYPLSYNEKNDITRFLKRDYLDIENISDLDKIIDIEAYDGNIIYLTNLFKNDQYQSIIESIKNKNILLVTNKNNEPLDIVYYLKELKAISNLLVIDKKYENKTFKNELLIYQRELIEEIKNKLNIYFKKENIEILSKDKIYSSKDFLYITEDYLNNKFSKFIPLNYELINKHNLSVPMKKARFTLIDQLLNEEPALYQKTFFNSTNATGSVARIILNDFIKNEKIVFPENYKILCNDIINKITKEEITFKDLYLNYCTFKLSYGLRKGFFTFLLGIIFAKNKESLSIISTENKNELEISGNLFDKIEKNPHLYSPINISINEEEKKFIDNLYELLKNYTSNKHIRKTENIIDGFRQYFYSLPRFITGIYLKETKILSKLINTIFQDKNSYDFILKELPKRARENNFEILIEILQNDLNYISNQINLYKESIEKTILKTMGIPGNLSLENSLVFYKNKNDTTNNSFQNWLKNYNFIDENEFLKDITEKVKGFSFENWMSEKDLEDFNNKLENLLNVNPIEQSGELIEFSINGNITTINTAIKKTPMGELLKKKLESDIKNMGITIKEEEKRLILIELLNKI